MKRIFLLTGMLIALTLIAFAPMSVMAEPLHTDTLILPHELSAVKATFPYFRDEGGPIEIEFSDSFAHTNSTDGYFKTDIYITCHNARGPYSDADQVVYPYPNLQENSASGNNFGIAWTIPGTDGYAWFDLRINEVD